VAVNFLVGWMRGLLQLQFCQEVADLLKIRLTRRGAKKDPHYRVVVSEKSSPRDGRFVEIVGYYNPALEPVRLHLELDRVDHWLQKGAQPTETVKTLIRRVRERGESERASEPANIPASQPTSEAASDPTSEQASEPTSERTSDPTGERTSDPAPQPAAQEA
jgi:small subunit ribosomal protein S16